MQSNRGKDTKPELALRRALWAAGLRGYRKNVRKWPGTPDVVYGRAKVAVFVHGCFWHGHGCAKASIPRSNRTFWTAKIERNQSRFLEQVSSLEAEGFRVLTVWECELKTGVEEVVTRIGRLLSEQS
ncbi:MAG: very short patch repair endonuclease [Armatimonadetes bacterium]|nr:very short patch repair endonuclease [Armatimonadota bacterium]